MQFSLEALDAKHGDCLILHVGDPESPQVILIDGGPRGVFRSLRARLAGIRERFHPNRQLPLALVVVSHVDSDHIHGILDLAKSLDSSTEEPPYTVKRLWHNSFEDVAGKAGPAAQALSTAGFRWTSSPLIESSAILQSVPQGKELRQIARKLTWWVNESPPGATPKMIVASGDPKEFMPKVVDGLSLKVLSPRDAEVEALRNAWEKALQETTPAEALARMDTSIFNLSSIVLLAEAAGKTMLLTGDSRSDLIVDGLSSAGLMKDGIFRCDVLKLPHHGSPRNVKPDFFRTVQAQHYVISADGKHGNPSVETLRMLTEARGQDEYSIWFTNRVEEAAQFLEEDQAGARRNYQVRFAVSRSGVSSVLVEVGDEAID